MSNFDIGIIGGGPAGYTYALHASAQGKSVVLFEKDNIGGVCLNKGCIPTKSILHSSEVYNQTINGEKFGVSAENISLDYSKVIERKNKTVETLRKGIELALKNAKVNVVKGEAIIIDKNTIKVKPSPEIQPFNANLKPNFNPLPEVDGTYHCRRIICATGSSPKVIKGLEFDHEFLLSSDDILKLEHLPQSILIVGSGAIGVEWARIFNNFGVETTVVELAPHLLPLADFEVSKRLERIFKTEKIKFYTETCVTEIDKNNKTVILGKAKNLTQDNGKGDSSDIRPQNDKILLEPELVLVAVGRVPNLTDKIEGVTYIGDVAGEIQLAHYAIKQAIEEIDGVKFHKSLTPSVVYGTPEIAWVGKREQDLIVHPRPMGEGAVASEFASGANAGEGFEKSLVLLSALGKAHCDGQTDGFVKILRQNGKIVGAHIVCPEASSLIQMLTIAIQNEISADKLKEVCFPHPTYSEGIFDALFKLC